MPVAKHSSETPPKPAAHPEVAETLRMAFWFALVSALAQLVVVASRKWVLGQIVEENPQMVWMAPAALLSAFAIPAVLAGLVAWRWPWRSRNPRFGLTLIFAFLAALNLMLAFDRLSKLAILLLAAGISLQAARLVESHKAGFSRLTRRSIVPMLALFALLGLGLNLRMYIRERHALAGLTDAPQGAPNVLLIILDTVRDGNMGLYGYSRPTTPELSELARSSTVFDMAIATAPWTLPSHASIMTGAWTHEHSATWHSALDDRLPTLAEELASRGYRTGGFVANLIFTSREYGLARGFAHYEDYPSSIGEIALNSPLVETIADRPAVRRLWGSYDVLGRKHANVIASDFLSWASASGKRPFFAFLNFMDAHDPYLPLPPFDTLFGPLEARRNDLMRLWGREGGRLHKDEMPERQRLAMIDAYDGGIAEADHSIGVILDSLGAMGVLENTIVIVTADHGEFFGEHGLYEHAKAPYLPVIRVPLLIFAPGRAPAGTRIETPVTIRDIPSTVMELAGLAAAKRFPGASLARWWSGEGPRAAEPVISELQRDSKNVSKGVATGRNAVAGATMRTIVLGNHQLLRFENGVEELYDYRQDPDELRNLADGLAGGPVMSQLSALLDSILGKR